MYLNLITTIKIKIGVGIGVGFDHFNNKDLKMEFQSYVLCIDSTALTKGIRFSSESTGNHR